jgi:hypothetical protein
MKRTWIVHAVILLVIAAIGIGPWIPVAIASNIAEANGCQLNEGSPQPCIVDGVDRSEDLYAMGMMGWIGVAACPVALIALLIYVIVLFLMWIWKRREAAKASKS